MEKSVAFPQYGQAAGNFEVFGTHEKLQFAHLYFAIKNHLRVFHPASRFATFSF